MTSNTLKISPRPQPKTPTRRLPGRQPRRNDSRANWPGRSGFPLRHSAATWRTAPRRPPTASTGRLSRNWWSIRATTAATTQRATSARVRSARRSASRSWPTQLARQAAGAGAVYVNRRRIRGNRGRRCCGASLRTLLRGRRSFGTMPTSSSGCWCTWLALPRAWRCARS